MKILVATDIHGSAYWAEKVVQKFEQTGAQALVLLGDIYNHGPRNPFPKDYAPMRVAEILNGLADKLIVVQGNCDSEVDQMISNFQFVRENVLLQGNRKLFFTHGHLHNKDNLPVGLTEGDVVFYGHFHVCQIAEVGGVTCVNVGSCSLPKDTSCYCLVDQSGVRLLDFDDKVIAEKSF